MSFSTQTITQFAGEAGQGATDDAASSIGECAAHHARAPMEARVLHGRAFDGLEDKEIAVLLGCSINTLRVYWHRIFRKTSMTGRAQVVAMAWRHGNA